MSFERALPIILRSEGGYVDDPRDRGGATNFGITQHVYHEWLRSKGKYARPVREITMDEVRDIYRDRYWLAARCDAMTWPLSLVVFDAAVNHGVGRAVRMLQQQVGATVDGKIGPQTLGAVAAADPAKTAEALLWRRVAFYMAISAGDQVAFLRGWIRRMVDLRADMAA